MAVMGLLFPVLLNYTHSEAHFGKSELALSRFSSCIMLLAYAAFLFFQLKSQRNNYSSVYEVDYVIFVLSLKLCIIMEDNLCCLLHKIYSLWGL